MAAGENPVKRCRLEPERDEYIEALERIANLVDNELGKGCTLLSKPDCREWKVQRVCTIRRLEEFREKLDPLSGSSNSGNAVENSAGMEGVSGSLIGNVQSFFRQWVPNIGNGLTSSPLVTNIGNLVQYTGTCVGASIKTEFLVSEKYLREIEAVLEEDRTLSRPLAKWLNFSNEVDNYVQEIFGVSFTSEMFNTVIKMFQELAELSNTARNFDDIISLLKQGKQSAYIGNDVKVEKLDKFYQCLSTSSQFADRMWRILSALTAAPESIRVVVDGVQLHHKIMGTSSSYVAPTVQGGLKSEVPPKGEVSVLQTIRLAINVISLINAASIIRHGTSQYSDVLKHVISSLSWEREQMEDL